MVVGAMVVETATAGIDVDRLRVADEGTHRGSRRPAQSITVRRPSHPSGGAPRWQPDNPDLDTNARRSSGRPVGHGWKRCLSDRCCSGCCNHSKSIQLSLIVHSLPPVTSHEQPLCSRLGRECSAALKDLYICQRSDCIDDQEPKNGDVRARPVNTNAFSGPKCAEG